MQVCKSQLKLRIILIFFTFRSIHFLCTLPSRKWFYCLIEWVTWRISLVTCCASWYQRMHVFFSEWLDSDVIRRLLFRTSRVLWLVPKGKQLSTFRKSVIPPSTGSDICRKLKFCCCCFVRTLFSPAPAHCVLHVSKRGCCHNLFRVKVNLFWESFCFHFCL